MGDTLEDSLAPFTLNHGACYTCYQYGAICTNSTLRRRPEHMKLALFGGLYSNYLALEAAIADAAKRGRRRCVCLEILERSGHIRIVCFLCLQQHNIQCVQGNYDDSIGNELDDCQCGYTDPKDNYFAQISYDYTLANTSDANKQWLRDLPTEIRLPQTA